MMEKKVIMLALVAASFSSALPALAADGQVNFTGNIVDAACKVTNDLSNPLNVVLGDVARTAFAGGKGSTSSATKFTLEVTDCPDTVKSATVKFDGAADNGDNNVLQLTQETDVATGVGIQLSDISNNVLPLYTASTAYPLASGSGVKNNLDFTARSLSTLADVTAGKANSVATFTLNYN